MDSQGEESHLEGETPGQSWSHAPCTVLCTQPPAFSNCTPVISFPGYLVSARFCGKREQWIELCMGWNLLEACPRLHPKILNSCLKILPRVSGQLELLLINNQLSLFDFNSTITSASSCQPVGEVIVPKNTSQSRTDSWHSSFSHQLGYRAQWWRGICHTHILSVLLDMIMQPHLLYKVVWS